MITKTTTYALYGDQIQPDGTKLNFHSEGKVSPYVKNYQDIVQFNALLAQQTGKVHEIKVWYPVKVEYIWFKKIKNWLKRKKK